MSAVHLNPSSFGSNASLKMVSVLGQWAWSHSDRWAGVSGSPELVYMCQVRVLRARFPAGNTHMAIQSKPALWQRNAPLLIQLRVGLSGKEKEQLPSPLWAQDARRLEHRKACFCIFFHLLLESPHGQLCPDTLQQEIQEPVNSTREELCLFF